MSCISEPIIAASTNGGVPYSPPEWYLEILACPNCFGTLREAAAGFCCTDCDFSAPRGRLIDLRPTKPRALCATLPRSFAVETLLDRVEIGRPSLTFKGPKGIRDGTELLSVMQEMLESPGRVLDLGCGPRDQAEPIASLGHQYVGIDLVSEKADIRADAHALPFRDASFDCVFSYTVLQHLHNPFVAFDEVNRVLKAGGVYIGTVSQGEPFQSSYFHYTAWGILAMAQAFDFRVLRLWSCLDTLSGLARMGSYPRVLRYGLRCLNWMNARLPILSPRKMRWPERKKALDEVYRAAHIAFVMRKEAKIS